MLPIPRREILTAKWWGGILRFGGLGYLLALFWIAGILFGLLNPLSVLFLAAACAAYLAFIASIGLWLSVVCRSTLWANLSIVLVLMMCILGIGVKYRLSELDIGSTKSRWLNQTPDVLINPGRAIYALTLSSKAFDISDFGPLLPEPDASSIVGSEMRKRAQQFFEFKLAILQVLCFSLAAAAFWLLARWRFSKAYR